MPFTSKNDINIIQDSDTKTLNAQKGDDIYVLGPHQVLKQHNVEISDSDGNNTLRFINNIHIKSAKLTQTTLKLTLDNDAVITVQNADRYFYGIGGDEFGRSEEVQTYSNFVKKTLGVEMPSTDNHAVVGEKTITGTGNSSDDDDYQIVYIDGAGDIVNQKTFDASNGNFKFIEDSTLPNNTIIKGFSNNDVIELKQNSCSDYNFTNEGADAIITLNNDGVVNFINLAGVFNEDVIIDEYDSFRKAVGYDVFV